MEDAQRSQRGFASSLVDGNDVCSRTKRVQVVGPCLHHGDTLRQIFRVVARTPNFVVFLVGQLHIDPLLLSADSPDSLKDFVDDQINQLGYGTSSEYIRELIRKEQARLQLCSLLLAGAASAPTKSVDDACFEGLRRKVRSTKSGARR